MLVYLGKEAGKRYGSSKTTAMAKQYPDPPILAFFVFLAFFVLWFSLLFCAFLLSFPRILRVWQRGKSLLFSGVPRFFSKKAGIGGSGYGFERRTLFSTEGSFGWPFPNFLKFRELDI